MFFIEKEDIFVGVSLYFRSFQQGTVTSASAHIRTALVGTGILSLAWAIAQLGWIAGIASLVIFSLVTLFTTSLLANCYRSPDPITGTRNYTYIEAVKNNLGKTARRRRSNFSWFFFFFFFFLGITGIYIRDSTPTRFQNTLQIKCSFNRGRIKFELLVASMASRNYLRSREIES